jgi:hypothetical protein
MPREPDVVDKDNQDEPCPNTSGLTRQLPAGPYPEYPGLLGWGRQPFLPPPDPPFSKQSFYQPPWKFLYQIVDKQGLVLTDIKAGDSMHFKSVSIPHFEIQVSNGKKEIVRFDKKCDTYTQLELFPISLDNDMKAFLLRWGFEKKFNDPDLKGILSITYEVLVRTDPTACEFAGQILLKQNCWRFIPTVSYYWDGQIPIDQLKSFKSSTNWTTAP